jgi:hypothetical protein
LQGLLLPIDITEIIVHKADQPETVVDFFDAHRLTGERSAEIDFLAENTNSPAASDQRGSIVEGIREFSNAAIRAHGGLVDVGRGTWSTVVSFGTSANQ